MNIPSQTLGKYILLAELGRGGFATVYRAQDPDLDREVALKVLDPLLMRDPVWVQRFRQEARAIARLKHPRIITIHEIAQAEGLFYIAAELIEGGSLADRLARAGRLSWEQVVRLVGEIAEALDYAHGQGVVHRDLKPANILLDPASGAILTDFGFARLVADHSLSVSLSGGVVGTPAYIAPETWKGQSPTPQTDIYALGCILYELATGKQRFVGATPPAVMLAHFQPPPMPDAWPEDVPPGLNEVLAQALALDPDERAPKAGQLAAAIGRLTIDRLTEPYAALERAIAGEHWDSAATLAREIREVNADYRDVAALEQKAQVELAQQKRRERLTELQTAAEEALAQKEWQQALNVVDEIKAIELDSVAASALEKRALAGIEQAGREKQAVQWREMAETAFKSGNLEGVELALTRWLELMPDDVAARQMQKRLLLAKEAAKTKQKSQAVSAKQEKSSVPRVDDAIEKREAIERLYQQAKSLLDTYPEKSKELADEIRALDPKAVGLIYLDARLRELVPNYRPADLSLNDDSLTPEEKRERIDQLYQEAKLLLATDPRKAYELTEQIRKIDPKAVGLLYLDSRLNQQVSSGSTELKWQKPIGGSCRSIWSESSGSQEPTGSSRPTASSAPGMKTAGGMDVKEVFIGGGLIAVSGGILELFMNSVFPGFFGGPVALVFVLAWMLHRNLENFNVIQMILSVIGWSMAWVCSGLGIALSTNLILLPISDIIVWGAIWGVVWALPIALVLWRKAPGYQGGSIFLTLLSWAAVSSIAWYFFGVNYWDPKPYPFIGVTASVLLGMITLWIVRLAQIGATKG